MLILQSKFHEINKIQEFIVKKQNHDGCSINLMWARQFSTDIKIDLILRQFLSLEILLRVPYIFNASHTPRQL